MRFLPGRRVVGIVDTRGSRIQGWVFDSKSDQPVTVEFYVDGHKVGSTVADGFRRDLTSVCPGGRCAFDFTLPVELQDGTLRTVEVRPAGVVSPISPTICCAKMRALACPGAIRIDSGPISN